jgi:hypothetical protein
MVLLLWLSDAGSQASPGRESAIPQHGGDDCAAALAVETECLLGSMIEFTRQRRAQHGALRGRSGDTPRQFGVAGIAIRDGHYGAHGRPLVCLVDYATLDEARRAPFPPRHGLRKQRQQGAPSATTGLSVRRALFESDTTSG